MLKSKLKTDGFKKKAIMMLIAQVIMYICPLIIPTWASVTEMGVKMLCVYIGVLFMFMTTGDIFSGSILGILATVLHGYYTLGDMLSFVFGSSISVQMIAMICFAYAVTGTGAFDVLGRKLVRATAGFKRFPFIFCVVFMLCMYVCLWYVSGILAVVTLIPLFEGIAKSVGYRVDEKWHKIMIIILFCFAGAGAYTRGTDGMMLGWIGVFQQSVAFDYVYKPFQLMISTRITLAVLVIVWMVLAKILGADMTKLSKINFDEIESLRKENTKMNKQQKIILVLFFIVIIRSLISNPFTEGTAAFTVYNIFDMKMCAFLAIVIGSYIRVDNKPVLNAQETMAKLPWGIFLVLGTMMVVAGALSSQELGIRQWLVTILQPIFGTTNYFVFCFMILFFTVFITNLMSNQATIMIMLSIAATFLDKFVDMGYNVTPLVGAVCCLGNFAFMLYCSGPNSPYYLDRPEIKANQRFTFTYGSLYLFVAVVISAAGAALFGKIM